MYFVATQWNFPAQRLYFKCETLIRPATWLVGMEALSHMQISMEINEFSP